MKAPGRLTPSERASLAIKILGYSAKADIEAAVALIEAESVLNVPAGPHAPMLVEVRGFLRALERVRRCAKSMRPYLEDSELIHPLESETAEWVLRCKRILEHPGIKHQRKARRNDAVETGKREAGLQAHLLLAKHGEVTSRRHNTLARILYGDEAADLRRYCRPPFVRAGVGNLISIRPFQLRPARSRK
jgi:hypothetical protein